jgi:hypothetical protein
MNTVGGLNAVAYLYGVVFKLLAMLTNSRLGLKRLAMANFIDCMAMVQ